MPKQIFQGKEGVWRTLPNGVHIFIPNGSDLDSEINKFADDDWETEYTKSQYADAILKNFTYADLKYWYMDKDTGKRVKPSVHAKLSLRNSLEYRDIVSPEYDELILRGLENNVTELIVNDRRTNWFRRDWWTQQRRIQIDIDSNNKAKILESLSHEIGHAIDCDDHLSYHSSKWKSPTFGVTMVDMFKQEVPDLDMLLDEADVMVDLRSQVIGMKEHISKREFTKSYFRYDETRVCIADMVQAIYGDSVCENKFGFLPHEKGYFKDNNENIGTELFAELTSCLFWDKEKRFYDVIKQHCPNTIKIYHEIIEEVKSKWPKNT